MTLIRKLYIMIKLTKIEAEHFLYNLSNPSIEIKKAKEKFIEEIKNVKVYDLDNKIIIDSDEIDTIGIESIINK